nr:Ig-like domain-containing protein [Serratia fonticola]
MTANANKAVKVKLIQGNKYLLKNLGNDFAPENITLTRVGNELHVIQEGDTQASIIIEDYFNGNASNPALLGMAEDGQLYAYVPLSGEGYESGYLTTEGEMTEAALGGPALGSGNGIFVTSDDDNHALFGLLGWVAAATAIGAGAAIANHNKNDGNNGDTTPPAKPSIGQALDNTGAITGPIKDGSVTDETKPLLSGTGEPGNTITVYDKGLAIGSTVVDGKGNWTFTPETPLSEGQHQLVITETDPSGNVSAPSDALNFGVDTVPPDLPAIQHIMDKVGDSVGEIKPGSATDDTRPELSGTGEAGSTVTIYDNGVEIGKAEVNSAGRWSFQPENPLADGPHNITVSQTDAAGNQSGVSDAWGFTVDTTAPSQPDISEILDNTGSLTGPLHPGDSTDETQPELSGKGEPGNVIIIEDNGKEIGSTTVDENGNWTFKPETPLEEGKHELVIVEEDQAGNKSEPSAPIEIIVDTTAPDQPGVANAYDKTGPITGIITGGSSTDETKPELTGVGEPGNTVTIYDNGEKIGSVVVGEDGKWSFTPDEALSESEHSITVTETDPAGNESKPSESLDFTVDTTPPLTGSEYLAITAVEDNIGDKQGNVASGEITDDSKPLISGIGTAGDTVFVYTTDTSGNHLIGSATVQADGTWSMTPELPLLEGNNQLAIIAQDAAGNRTDLSSPSYDITIFIPIATGDPAIITVVDNVEPHTGPLQKGEATNDSTPTLNGTAAAESIVTIYDNGVAIGSTTSDDKGRWSFTPETALADGSHNLYITATDAAGNVSAPSGGFGLVIDTTVPEAATDIVITDNVGDKTGPVAPGETTDDRSPTLSGKGEPGSTVNVIDNGREIGTATVDDNGHWTFTPEEPLDNGEHTLTTTVTDPAGNTSEPSPGISIVVDDTEVTVSVGAVKDDVGPITGNITPGGVTDDTRPELTGSGKPGSVVTVQDGDTVLGTTTVQPDGSWRFTPETDLGEGEHHITVTAEDAAGNRVTSPSVDFTVDSVAPNKPSIGSAIDDVGDVRGELASGSVTDDANPTFKGSAEPGSAIKVYDNGELIGSVMTDNNGAWTFTPTTPLAEGEHSLTTTATDKAGNTSAPSDAFELTTDYTPSPTGPEFLAITGVEDNVGSVQGNVASGGITDDSLPRISGIGTAGDTVFVYTADASGNHVIGSATVQADGTWSLTPTTPLLEGSNQLTLVAVDAAGNKTVPSTPSYDLTVDITVPGLPAITSVVDNVEPHTGPLQKGDVTNDSTPTLNGTAEAGSTVTVYDNGQIVGSTTADANGKWTLTPETALADGSHNLYITATDAAGNVSAPSGGFGLVIDTTVPEAATDIVITDNVGDKTGPVAPGETTDDRSPTLSGKGEPGSTVNVIDNGREIGTATVDDNGNWTFTPEEPLDNGEHTLTTTVTDPAGNTSEPSPGISIVVDDTEVTVSVGAVKDDVGPITGNITPGGVTDDTRPELTGSGKPGSVVTVQDGDTVLGTTTVQPDGSWRFTPETDLGEGEHHLTVTAEDAAGNRVTSPSVDFTVDSVAPNKPSIGSAIDDVGDVRGELASGSVTDDANPTFKGSAEPGSAIKVYDNGELIGSVMTDNNGAWTFTPTTPLAEGEHSLTTTATDKAGNTSAPSDAFELTTDYTPSPTGPEFLAITGVEDNVGSVQGNVASGGITDDSLPRISGIGTAGDTVFVYTADASGNHVIGSATVQADGTWSLTPTTPLLEGSNQLTLVAVDAAGNKTVPSTPSYDLTVDITVPGLPAITSVVDNVEPHTGPLQKGDVTNDSTPTLNGTAEAGSTVTVYDNGQIVGSTTADANGKWTLTPETALADGSHNLYITATDAAGNVSAPSGGFGLVIDTTVPEAATDIVITDNVGDKTGPVAPGETTDDRSPTLSGKGEPGSTVNVIDNGREIGTATVDDNGNWTFTPEEPLDNGEHTLTTTVTDPAGNTSEPSPGISIVVDDTEVTVSVGAVKDDVGPITGNITPGGVTDDTRPELTGSGKPGSVVTVQDGDTVLGTTTVQPDGSWRFTPETDLGEGEHHLTVTAEDAAGNRVTSPSVDFTVDSVAPNKPSIGSAIDDVGDVRGELASGSVTDDANPTFKGSAEPGSTIKVYDNGELIGSVMTDNNGAWTFTPTTPLTEGEHSLTTTATDKAGNTSAPSDAFELTTDYTPSPTGPEFLAITGVEDNVGSVQGNVASGGITDDSLPRISGIGSAGDTILVYTKDSAGNHVIGSATVQADGTWSLTPTTPLLEGSNQLTLVAVDAAGNKTAPSTPSYDLTVDITVPALPAITSVVDNVEPHTGPLQKGEATNDSTPTLNGTAEAGSTVLVYDNTTVIGSVVADANGKWTLTPEAALADGSHNLYITATDAAGNVSAPSGGFGLVIDTTVPEAATDIVITDNVGDKTGPVAPGETTDDRSPTLSGKGEPGSTVNVIDNGKEIGTATVDDNGHWTFTPEEPLDNGEHTLSTTVTDPAGNTSEPSPGISIVVDDTEVTVSVGAVKDDVGPITGNITPGGVTDDTRPELTGSGKPGSVVTVQDGDTVLGTTTVQPDGSWRFTPETDLGEGEHHLTVTAEDAAGNRVTSPSVDFTVDSVAPNKPSIGSAIDDVGDVRGELASGSVTDDANPTFKGSAEPGSTIKVYDNGELIGSVMTDNNGAWTFTPTTPLTEGEHSLTTTATDKAGNTSAPSDAFELTTDYSAPDASKVAITDVNDQVGLVTGSVSAGGMTDDNRPTISGTGAEAGNTITVYNGTTVIGTATVQADGTWSLKPTLPLADGLVTLTAKETDNVGNTTVPSPEYAITVVTVAPNPPVITSVEDNAEPHTGALQKGDVTNDNTPTLKGSALPGGTVTVFDNGTAIGSVVADHNGAWTFTPETALKDGNHSLTASVTDSIGQTSPTTGGFGIVIDTAPPAPVTGLTVTDDVGAEQGALTSGATTDDNTPTFSGKAEGGSTVTILDNGKAIGSVVADSNGNWAFTPGTALENGAHDFTTTVTDPAGNTSAEGEHLTVTVDVVPGQVALTTLVDDVGTITGTIVQNGVTDDTRPTLNGTAKAGSIVTVKDGDNVLGSTTAKADGSWRFTPTTDLGQGAHSLSATAIDPAGNPSSSGSWSFTVDTVKPTAPTIDSAADDVGSVQPQNMASGSATDDPTPTLSGRAEANSIVTISDQNGVLGSAKTDAHGDWTFTPSNKLSEGDHRFTVTATDAAGNVSDKSNTFVLTLDFSAPDASLVAITGVDDQVGGQKGNVVAGGTTDDNRPTISGTGAEAGNTITVYNGTTVIGTATVQADGTWSLKPTLPLADGLVTLTAKETDSVGNTTVPSPEYAITVVTVAPNPPVITSVEDNAEPHTGALQKGDVTNDNTPTLNGTALAGGTVTVFDNGVAIGSTVANSNGAWTFTPSPALGDGNHNLTASVTDSIGQTSPTTGGFGIVIDTAPPAPVTGLTVTDDVGAEQGALTSGATTDDNTPTFSGKAEGGSTVTILDNGKAIGSVVADSNGNWTFTPGTALENGAHDFTTTVTDPAGNTSAEGEHLTVTVDVVPGQVALTTLVDDVGTITGTIVQNGVTDDTRPTLNGTAKAGSIVTVKDGDNVLGSTTAKADGSWSFTPTTDLGQGAHSLSATAVDPAGNPSSSGSWSFTVDTVKPTAPTIDSAADDVGSVQPQNMASGSATDDPTPTLSGRAEANSIVTISDQNGVLGSAKTDAHGDWTFTPSSKLSEGDHRFTVTATDAAGNVSDKSNTFVLTLDFSAPDASLVAITGVDDQVGGQKGNVVAGGTTDDNRPTISGTGAEAGNTITVYNGTTVIGTATVQADGTWSLKPALPLADGLVTLTAKETDSVGNTTVPSPEYAITVVTVGPNPPVITSVEDNAEPHTGALQKGDVTNDNTPTLNGTALAGGTVTVFDNGVAIGSTVANSNGAWTFTPSPALGDGNHNLTASVTDSIGQTSPTTGGFGIVIDTAPPAPVTGLTVTDDVGAEQGALTSGATTDDNTPTFSGKAEGGSTVTILDNGKAIGSVVADSNGNWTFTPGTALENGAHDFTTTVTDPAGNTSAEGEHLTVTVDVVPGQVALTSLVDDVGTITGTIVQNGVTDDTRPTLNGTAKAGSIVTVKDGDNVLGSTTAKADGSWSFTPTTDLGQGAHSLSATAVDPAGNPSSSGSWSFTVDTVKPTAPTIDSAADDVGSVQPQNMASGSATDDPTPTLSGRAEANSIVTISDQNGVLGSAKTDASGDWTFTPSSKLSEGDHRFTVTATDAAGNVSDKSNTFVLTLDFSAPDASLVAITGVDDQVGGQKGNVVAGGTTDDNRPTISGTGAEAGNTITVYNGTTVIGTATVQADGTWSLKPALPLADGLVTLTAKETDSVGNTTVPSPEYAITVVTVGPNPPVITSVEDNAEPHTGALQKGDVTNDNTPTLNGTALAGGTVTVFDNGVAIGSTVANSNGAWTFTPETALKDGNHNLTASVTDSIGQTSEQTGIYNIQIDTAPPAPVTGLTVTDDVGAEQGALTSGATTDDNTPTFSGKAEGGSTVTILDNGKAIGSVVADSNGNWAFTPGTALENGAHDFTTTVTDPAGNTSAEGEHLTVTVDVVPGQVALTSLVDDVGTITGTIVQNGVTDDTRPTLNGTAKAGSIVTVKDGDNVLGSTTAKADGSWSFTPTTDLGQGAHSLSATAIDPAGNPSSSGSWSFTVDSVKPTAPTIDSAADDVGSVQPQNMASGSATDDPTPTLSGRAEANSIVTISDQNGVLGSAKTDASGQWSFTPTTKLPEGEHRFTVTAKDAAGNVSDPSNTFVLTLDFTAPDVSKIAITDVVDNVGSITGSVEQNGVLDDRKPVIKGTGAEVGDIITVSTTDSTGNTIILGTTTVGADGTWTLAPTGSLYDGLNKLTVTETDSVGNIAKPDSSYSVNVSLTPGVPSITGIVDDTGANHANLAEGALTKDSTPTLSGTSSVAEGNIITIYNGSTVVGTTTAGANGDWSFTPTGKLDDGDYNFTVKATNSAGQTSEASNSWSITIDTAAPGAVTDLVITDDVGEIQGPLHNGDVTDDAKPTFSGTAEAGSKVTIYDDGVKVGEAIADSTTGKWSWTPADNMLDGAHNFTTTVTDLVGNESAPSANVNLTIDTKAPEVTLAIEGYYDDVGTNQGLILGSGGSTDDTSPVLKGTWSGDLLATDTIRIYQDGQLVGAAVIDLVNRSWTLALTELVNTHTYTYTATAVDVAGNETAISPDFTLTIDLDAPTQTVVIDSYSDDVGLVTGDFGSGTSTDDRNPTLNGHVNGNPLDAGDEVRIYDAASNQFLGIATVASNGSWTFVLPPLNDDTTYNFRAVVADQAGNEGTVSNNFTMTIDLAVVVNAQNTLDTTPIVSGYTGFDIQPGEYVEVTINGKTYSSQDGKVVVDPRNNTWYVQIPDADALQVGTYDVQAVLYSADGKQITTDDSVNELVIAPTPVVTVGAGGGDANQKATAVTIGEDGVWRIHTNQTMLDATGTSSSTLGDFSATKLVSNSGAGYSGTSYVQNATFIDYNRDGLMDLFAVDSQYDDGQQMFYYNGSTYKAYQVGAFTNSPQTGEFAGDANTAGSANTWSWYGGIIAIDKDGDGYVDMILGDQTPNDSGIRGGYGSQIVLNHDGTVVGMDKDGTFATDYATDANHRPIGLDQSQPDMELSGVDLNNDGIVDFVMHSQNIVADGSRVNADGATNNSAAISSNQARLVVVNGTNNGDWKVSQIVENVFQRGTDDDPNIGNGVAMTWADFNGDGYMDLFLGRGSESTTSASGAGNNAGEYASRIYFNDGNGKLIFSDPNNDGIGNPTAAGMYTFTDNLAGGASIALDWNHDGKMDVIELPGMSAGSGGINAAAATGPINLYTNTSSGGTTSFTTTNLLTQIGKTTIGGTNTGSQVTGAIAIDIDWDGDRDLLAFTSNGVTTYIENKNNVAYGTSIHLRILDEGGINSLYGNTVQLIDEATGQVVSTQVINAQSGNQTNDSSAIVDFYGLDASKTYSAVILRSSNGAFADVGGVASVGNNTVEIVNKAWAGLKAAEANQAYVLTTESETNVANASTNGGTNATGIVGTGYNDTFFATLGNDLYNGGGGTETVSGVKSWSDTGGLDVVDYKLAGSAPLTIDLSKTGMQSTGFGNAQFVNIEGLAGGSGNDTFTGNAANNYFDGRGGNDTFNLIHGGQDTLMYRALDAASANGGNGHDTVNDFFVGTVEATPNADIIDVSGLLVGYRADADGAAHYINGVATIDAGDTIRQYLSITYSGNDSILNIDRDGIGSTYGSTELLTFSNTHVDLETLLANHQLVISNGNLTADSLKALAADYVINTVDYSASSEAVTANLWTGATTAGTDKLVNVDALIGSAQGDTFTDNSASNLFEGGGGNDTFYLVNGGNDTLMYKLLAGLENDVTGGNGHDTVHGFHVGNVAVDNDADLIDLSAMLDYNGSITFFQNENGQFELDDASKGINDYLKVETVGNDTVISIDRDGLGGQYTSSSVITLADVHTDLQTLLQNNQIIV